MVTGKLVSIQRCSVHDGPGIRTTVFFKGCQLHCPWCHNPESISFDNEEFFYPDKCIKCGQCRQGCYAGARVKCGMDVTVGDVISEVRQDKPYYREDGGITLSGGEPLCQIDFAEALLDECRKEGIGTALESNLCVKKEFISRIIPKIDILMTDCKLFDGELHKKWTGMTNTQAKENYRLVSEAGIPIIMRTPVITGINDSVEEISRIAELAASLKSLRYYELLSYHPLGVSKSIALGKEQQKFETPSKEKIHELALAAQSKGIEVLVNSRRITDD